MTPIITVVRMTGARHRSQLPLLVLGPALGTSASGLWGGCAERLVDHFDVVAWDLPGHGHNRAVPEEPFTVADLAAGVLAVVDDVLVERGQPRGPFFYAGVSMGGCVGLQLLLDAPDRVVSAVLLGTGSRIGTTQRWQERAATVRASGTAGLVPACAERWFGPGFRDRDPERSAALLRSLADTLDAGYLGLVEALAAYDAGAALPRVRPPVLAVAGSADVATPPSRLRELADGVTQGSYVELDGVGHLAPAEASAEVARLLRSHFLGHEDEAAADVEPHGPAEAMRRAVLGDDHVDTALAATTDFTRAFEELTTTYVWGEVWSRPGLDRRSRSIVTLTALIARGHHDELAVHVRAALRSGLGVEELREVLLHTAVYCGLPAAGAAFRVASQVLREEGLL